jgi:ribosomal protein S27E
MKILKHGTPRSNVVRTECRDCGCEFEFNRKEARLMPDFRDGDFYSINCPDCKKLCTVAYSLTV